MAPYQLKRCQKCLNYSRQRKCCKCEQLFLNRDKCLECFPSACTYYCQITCKTRNSFINWTYEKLSHILLRATFNSETVLGYGWFQNSFLRRSKIRYLQSIQIWRVIRWTLFLFSHLRTVLVEALLRDTCNARRAPCLLLNLLLRLAAVGCTLQLTLGAEINKQLQLLFTTALTVKFTVMSLSCKAGIKFCWNKWELVNSKQNAQNSSSSCI